MAVALLLMALAVGYIAVTTATAPLGADALAIIVAILFAAACIVAAIDDAKGGA
jgi:hypothetical protein